MTATTAAPAAITAELTQRVSKIYALTERGETSGTAFLLGLVRQPAATLAVFATAAHCVHTGSAPHDDGAYRSVRVLCGATRYPHRAPRTSRGHLLPAQRIVLPQAWTSQGALDADYAFVTVELSAEAAAELPQTWMRLRFDAPPEGAPTAVLGLPNSWWSRRVSTRLTHRLDQPFADSSAYRIGLRVPSGASGGPWITWVDGEPVQFSTTSFAASSQRGATFGPHWGAEASELLEQIGCPRDRMLHHPPQPLNTKESA